jgi:poly(A) polymerase
VENAPTSSKPPSRREDALAIVKRLRESGQVSYFAGGCVRDTLLGLEPKDYDVATDAPPGRVRELFRNTQAVGAAFGVILVRQGKSVVEVATFRTDVSYEDGRRPTAVRFTSAREDAQRRDFTINGLFYDPIEEQVIDYVGGQEDLKNKVLRAIGEPEHRFTEDHLRLLRAVRFASRFGLEIEAKTAAAIEHHAQHLKRISPERIAEELRLMLTPSTRTRAYDLLRRFNLDKVILRFLDDAHGHGEIFSALAAPTISFGLALAAMSLDARGGKLPAREEVRKAASALRQALRISNQESDQLEAALSFAPLLHDEPPTVA